MIRGRLACLMPMLALAACGSDPAPDTPAPRDPQMVQALNDPLMTDPDLASRNEAAGAITIESDFSLPVLPATPEEIARAKAEAADVAGGAAKLVPLGEPQGTTAPLAADASPAARLAARLGSEACRDALEVSAIWAARFPAAMPIYPRGHTLDAAGSNAKGCRVRTVAFTTPVPQADVLAFYLARIRMIGGGSEGGDVPLARAGEDLRLIGAAGPLAYDIFARPVGDYTLVRVTTIER